ncbi:SPOR domain-containing protein [uncultured Gelidibacter sp.]|uniref:SPOR domain-containing protein n=1 Tax=uncultured Gelidibacter sp. TaxID=259318 RepID=UPI00261A5C44|nr:SPOR domain-containing protein [uncultured Gelidibacter sp.]
MVSVQIISFKNPRLFILKEEDFMIKPILKTALIAFTLFSTTTAVQAQQGTVSVDQPRDIDKLLEFKKDLRSMNAFRIQVYNGSRGGAESAKAQAASLFPNWSNSIEYEQPNYKIWVGNFRTRLEADRALITVKKTYANAFILLPKINK